MTEHHMHDHQLDLIMDLAAGTLEGRRRDDAAASVAACEECQAELEAQMLAIEALAAAPTPRLSELEAARMRRVLRDELSLVTPEPVAAETHRPRSFPWQRLSVGLSIAAVLLLFVAVVPALDLFGGAGSSDADSVALAPAADVPNEAVTESADRETDPTDEAELGFASSGAESTTTALAAPADGRLLVDFGPDPDLLAIRRASELGLAETGDAANLVGLTLDLDSVVISEKSDECVDEALGGFAAGRTPVTLGAGIVLDEDVFVVGYVNEEDGTVEVVAHDAATCAVVTSTG